jgi:DNA-binding IclR family transcriptional regulator
VKSAFRALQILELFDELERGASVKEVADGLGLPRSSTSYLLRSLVEQGYARYDAPQRRYWPTPRVAVLGRWLDPVSLANGRLHTLMRDVERRTGCLVALGIPQPEAMQIIDVVCPDTPTPLSVRPGTRRPYTRTAIGRVLLAQKPADMIRRIHLRERLEAQNSGTASTRTLLGELDIVRRNGNAVVYSELIDDVALFAVPLPSAQPMALGLGGPAAQLRPIEAEIVATMRAAVATCFAGDARA